MSISQNASSLHIHQKPRLPLWVSTIHCGGVLQFELASLDRTSSSGESGTKRLFSCYGTMINERTYLTSRHGVNIFTKVMFSHDPHPPSPLKVALGCWQEMQCSCYDLHWNKANDAAVSTAFGVQ